MIRQTAHIDEYLEEILQLYRHGYFPMGLSRDSNEIGVFDAPMRGILLPKNLHIAKRLHQVMQKPQWAISVDQCFNEVINYCAATRIGGIPQLDAGLTPPQTSKQCYFDNGANVLANSQSESWINGPIKDIFCNLHEAGYAHSLEVWHDGVLAGGIYGLGLGGVFFGESMFHLKSHASKIALVQLVLRLKLLNYQLFDCQFLTNHLASFGVKEVKRASFMILLKKALNANPKPLIPSTIDNSMMISDIR